MPIGPAGPDRGKLLLAGVGLALGFGLGIGVLREMLDRRVHDPEEAAALLGVPLLGAIPRTRGSSFLAASEDGEEHDSREMAAEEFLDGLKILKERHNIISMGWSGGEPLSVDEMTDKQRRKLKGLEGPIDWIDFCCMEHDFCYYKCKVLRRQGVLDFFWYLMCLLDCDYERMECWGYGIPTMP